MQKSKIHWLQDGDGNTRFLHLTTKSRSIHNHIDSISVGGNLIEEEVQIRDQADSYFPQLFQSAPSNPDESLNMVGPSISNEQNQQLTAIPTAAEIRKAVFSLKKSSSQGPHGFTRAFFTDCQLIVSIYVTQAVVHFFSSGRLLRATNAYFLTLIPKIQSPKTFYDFRPISLLNFSYKVISRILASTLAGILPLLISKHQSAFFNGRTIHHHVALAHELFHQLKSKIRGDSVGLKLDISKAFDKLQWNFLFRALQFFQFPLSELAS